MTVLKDPTGSPSAAGPPPPREDRPATYAAAGVDIAAWEEAFGRIKGAIRSTFGPQVVGDIGGFGGLYAAPRGDRPVLVSSVDSVGTKVRVAIGLRRHDTVGYDIVNHCVNDILCGGARPLFFLDYIGTSRLDPSDNRSYRQRLGCGLSRQPLRLDRRRNCGATGDVCRG